MGRTKNNLTAARCPQPPPTTILNLNVDENLDAIPQIETFNFFTKRKKWICKSTSVLEEIFVTAKHLYTYMDLN